ncbi:TPA: phage major capsid protein [Escherichia coli]|nr:phage major capsid protein [Escherichia coli]HBZ8229049.1 phage major capsid protein [Escherichia coli]HBZ8345777.1 phage major capsid protein [Escherichia coli]HBZ8350846.1 phage major capsid protein [Escherichia coli]HBZ8356178.1 phage major capsid protein [Escherichia coli]
MLKLKREYTVQDITETDGIFEIAFSSETPVERQIEDEYGHPVTVNEILVHEGAHNADLTRINNGAALLFNHDFDKHLGKVIPGSVRIDSDRIGRAKVQFSKFGDLANEVREKVKEGTISKISFGYDLNEYVLQGNDLLVTLWSPYEISFVTVPADDSVGLGRLLNTDNKSEIKVREKSNQTNKGNKRMKRFEDITVEEIVEMAVEELTDMSIDEIESLSDEARAKREEILEEDKVEAEQAGDSAVTETDTSPAEVAVEDELTEAEREEEAEEILEVAERYKVPQKDVAKAIAKGMTARQFKRSIKPNKAPVVIRKMTKDTKVNLENKFDLSDAVRSMMAGKAVRGAAAEYTQEMTRKRLQRGQNVSTGIYLPVNALAQNSRAINTVSTVSSVQQEVQRYDSFVEMLLKGTVADQLGMNILSGLTTPISVPKQTKSSVDAFGFVDENGESPEGESSFTNIQFMPKTFTGGNPISRQALLTMPNLGSFIADHIVKQSRAKLEGLMFGSITDAKAPESIVAQLVAQKMGMSYKEFIVEAAKAKGNGVDMAAFKYLMAAALEGDLKTTLRDQNVAGYIIDDMNKIGGHDVIGSGLVKDGQVISGDFSAVTVAEWEGLALDLDDTTYRNKGAIVPRVWADIDWKLTADDRLYLYEKVTPAEVKAAQKASA